MALGESVEKLKVSELKELAKGIGAVPEGKKKADYLTSIEGTVASKFDSMKVDELRTLAKNLAINLGGKKKKVDITEQIILSLDVDGIRRVVAPAEEMPVAAPAVSDAGEPDAAESELTEFEKAARAESESIDKAMVTEELEGIGEDLVRIEKDVEVVMEDVAKIHDPDMADIYEIDKILTELVNMNVDYANVGSLLDVGRVKFLDKKYLESMSMLREAIVASREFFEEYLDVTFAVIIQSAERILEECRDAKSNDEKAADALIEAKRAFMEKGANRLKTTEHLYGIATRVYREEVELLEDCMTKRENLIKAMKVQGVDTFNAERYLHRAREVFLVGEMADCMTYLEKSETVANDSKNIWIKEIDEAVPKVEGLIKQAQEFGTDTAEAEKHLDQAKTALKNKDYSLCAELTKLAERKAMEGQQSQIHRAAQLEKEKLGDAQKILASISPLVQEAQLYGLNTRDIDQTVNASMTALQKNDYVNAMTHAQQAETMTKYLKTQVEAEREKIIASGGPFKTCSVCGAVSVKLFSNGWARCMGCGQTFQVISDKGKKRKWGLFGK
jgi:hypothetical protein